MSKSEHMIPIAQTLKCVFWKREQTSSRLTKKLEELED
jgi:hypothetical protein